MLASVIGGPGGCFAFMVASLTEAATGAPGRLAAGRSYPAARSVAPPE